MMALSGRPVRLVNTGRRVILAVSTRICSSDKAARYTIQTGHFSTQAAPMAASKLPEVKPFSEIPEPKGLPLVGTFFEYPNDASKRDEFYRQRCKQYFPIYRENLGIVKLVVIHDQDAIEKLFRSETKYPYRNDLPSWTSYRQVSGESYGLLTSQGEDWRRMRRVVDKPMLRMKDVASYAHAINEVATDFIKRLAEIRDEDGLVPGLETELFNWSLESIGKILYERRFGGLSDNRDPELQEFIDAVHTMLQTTTQIGVLPAWIAKLVARKAYNAHIKSWDVLFKVAKKCVNERMEELASTDPDGDEPGGVLSYLLRDKSLPIEEIYSNITDLMTGAVDSTSTSMLWLCEEIAVRPDIQQKLLVEIKSVLPDDRIPSYKDLQNMPYLKAVVKESHRMRPAVEGIGRVTQEDIPEVCGYHIPAKTVCVMHPFVLNRLPQYFDHPDEFRPERWLRENTENGQRPPTLLTFGRGTRMCIGRRVAELEMHLLLSQLIQRFSIEPGFTERAKPTVQVVIRPDRPIRIKLKERN